MRAWRLILAFLILLQFAVGCAAVPKPVTGPSSPTFDLAHIVQATLGALTAQAATRATAVPSTPTASSAGGSISGSLSYPADALPAMYVVAYEVAKQNRLYVTTKAGQATYQIDNIPPGTYHIIAYTVGGGGFPVGFSGGYTKAVPCGLAAECADHSLIDVTVAAGQQVTDIKPADWYAPPGAFPPFPEAAALATAMAATSPATQAPVGEGSIAGNLMYPSSALPALRIVAFQVGSSVYFHTDTSPGQSSYQLDHLPPGTYHVVAYVLPGAGFTAGRAGGYSQMVPCGLQHGCNDHTLIDVAVTAGHVTTGVNPNDFYADAGTFPADPVP